MQKRTLMTRADSAEFSDAFLQNVLQRRRVGFGNSLTAKGSENAIYLVFRASIDLDLGW